MHIDHIKIRSSPEIIDRVKSFYCDALGLEEGYRPNSSRRGYWLYSGRNPVVHLSIDSSSGTLEPTGNLDHVAFQVSDLSEIIGRLERLGIEFGESYVDDRSMRQIFFKDPAGVKVEVNCFDD